MFLPQKKQKNDLEKDQKKLAKCRFKYELFFENF